MLHDFLLELYIFEWYNISSGFGCIPLNSIRDVGKLLGRSFLSSPIKFCELKVDSE
jgi:hypothetical protein